MDIERYKQRLLEVERKLSFQVGHELVNARETRGDQPGHGDRAMVVIVIVSLLKKLHSGEQENVHVGQTRCTCGWSGSVSKYKPVCPKCAKPLRV